MGVIGDFASSVRESLLPYASKWWFPWAVGLLSGINTYLLFLSGPVRFLVLILFSLCKVNGAAVDATSFGCISSS